MSVHFVVDMSDFFKAFILLYYVHIELWVECVLCVHCFLYNVYSVLTDFLLASEGLDESGLPQGDVLLIAKHLSEPWMDFLKKVNGALF